LQAIIHGARRARTGDLGVPLPSSRTGGGTFARPSDAFSANGYRSGNLPGRGSSLQACFPPPPPRALPRNRPRRVRGWHRPPPDPSVAPHADQRRRLPENHGRRTSPSWVPRTSSAAGSPRREAASRTGPTPATFRAVRRTSRRQTVGARGAAARADPVLEANDKERA